ncbi:hypothetical protein SDC9_177064 [bioreactor metagenome]|uniref:Uncharacterized protein n=1 Tax=bioreactor metagenome TaxID=1076179 RepID=A0A645GRX7_9ZZZZ
MAVDHKRAQQRMKARLDGGTKRGKALHRDGVCLRLFGTRLFGILKVACFVSTIKRTDRGIIHHRIRAVRLHIAQAKAGGLDRHEALIQLDGSVAAAALHIVPPCARALRKPRVIL